MDNRDSLVQAHARLSLCMVQLGLDFNETCLVSGPGVSDKCSAPTSVGMIIYSDCIYHDAWTPLEVQYSTHVAWS